MQCNQVLYVMMLAVDVGDNIIVVFVCVWVFMGSVHM